MQICNSLIFLKVDGITTIEVRRKLNTGDPQDRPIESGPVRIVWAFGKQDKFGYHEYNRGFSGNFFLNTNS